MAFVLDASIAASWFLPDEQSEAAEPLITALGAAPGLVPSLFWFEVRNLFIMAERRGRLQPGTALAMTLSLHGLPLRDSGIGNDVSVIDLALKHGLSGYDASYVALAKASEIPLATADRKMAAAARSEGIHIVGPLEHEP
ncbi:type II toxin-antitoxin system VapC family toxin [Rhizobium gallicum]|uniref:type II toxin-antitoxin system VapC family toxin n=1 Tax=Rhizobium gallicum TaxID=56730 RepID=UPI001EF87205|nr:type II toxin-antitoxin system VapC family toxin [Rhizobium gallicum]ULJ74428.1 type II toxin-antitoxin system VapC family toxin [Rhizobium gallicum]